MNLLDSLGFIQLEHTDLIQVVNHWSQASFAPKRIHLSALKAKGVRKYVCHIKTRRHIFVWADAACRGNTGTIRNREQVQAAAYLHASHRTEIIALHSRCCKSQDAHPGLIIEISEHSHWGGGRKKPRAIPASLHLFWHFGGVVLFYHLSIRKVTFSKERACKNTSLQIEDLKDSDESI